MAHVTFIHGIGNKPTSEDLLQSWQRTLAAHDLNLSVMGISSSMAYWADFLYPSPVAREADFESAEAVDDASVPDIGLAWAVEAEGEEARFIRGMAASIGYEELATDQPVRPLEPIEPAADQPPASVGTGPGPGFERVPLPGPIKRRLMKILLRDVHHYLYDTEFSPRPGVTHKIREVIRKQVVKVLQEGEEAARRSGGRHVVVSHSMGTVIVYDCLRRVPDCPAIDGLMTIGSPLGLDEVQDALRPEWTRADGFPGDRLRGEWVNVYDRLDPVCGFDPRLANDFQHEAASLVHDFEQDNGGRWRHGIDRYLAKPTLRTQLRQLLESTSG
jgi:hypothetical protein